MGYMLAWYGFASMTSAPRDPTDAVPRSPWYPGQRAYAIALFAIAAVVLGASIGAAESPLFGIVTRFDAVFFFLYGLFTISVGYRHPQVGYYSFDRIGQVASILVLGPLPAACVNGLASFIYPWHRLLQGVPIHAVLLAALNNSGLMALIVLAAGSLYQALGGPIPLTALEPRTVLLLLALVLTMQILNELGMLWLRLAGRRPAAGFFQPFSVALELSASATAVLVALVYNTMPDAVLVLLLAVLTLGMFGLRQFARMRQALEGIVAERTKALREKTAELELLATRDKLTNLFNRRHADDYLDALFRQTDPRSHKLTIAIADIDFFKQVNDTHSHTIGDLVLKRVADILSAQCRPSDMIARYGGEEFLICFPDTGLNEGDRLCEELRAAIENDRWRELGLTSGVTISFGVAERQRDASPRDLLLQADLRLYEAKRRGRNRVIARAV
jgi:diguanylate cyclase (GGDEF)-like protein